MIQATPFVGQLCKSSIRAVSFNTQLCKSVIQATPFMRQLCKSIMQAIPFNRQLCKSIIRAIPSCVSCELDNFRVDTHLCKLSDISNFANRVEELDWHTICMKICGRVVSLSFTFYFEIIPTTTVVVGSTRNKIINVLIKPKIIKNISLSTTSIHSSSKSI